MLNVSRKKDCAKCFTEKIIGNTCKCGHTDIRVLQPCGHSVCANPCYYQLKSQTITTNDYQFKCPLCYTVIARVFRAEEFYMGKFRDEFITNDLIKEITSELFDLNFERINCSL